MGSPLILDPITSIVWKNRNILHNIKKYTLTGHFIRYTCSIANQPITWQQLNAFRHLDVVKTTCKFKPSIRMGKKGDLSDFERGIVVGARRAEYFKKR